MTGLAQVNGVETVLPLSSPSLSGLVVRVGAAVELGQLVANTVELLALERRVGADCEPHSHRFAVLAGSDLPVSHFQEQRLLAALVVVVFLKNGLGQI